MSAGARQELCSRLIFQRDSQRADLLNDALTKTQLVAFLLEVSAKYPLEITSIKTDHGDDRVDGEHCHFNGWCADLWPLRSQTAGDYLDASDPEFTAFLRFCAASPWLHQIGLAGSAYTEANMQAAGATAFHDDDEDHVHLGAQ